MSHDEDELEAALGVALRRVDAPNGFADGVMERVQRSSKVRPFPVRQLWIGGIAASLLAGALSFGGWEHRLGEERAKAERDFARSQEITAQTMELTRKRLRDVGAVLD